MREYRTLSSRGGRRELRPWHLALTGVVCLLLGIVVGYRAGDGGDDDDTTGDSGTDEQAVTDSLLDGASVTTTTTAVLPATQVRVLVLNGAGIDGEAGRQSDQLEELGYRMLQPGNTDAATQTAVYWAPDFQDECQVVADTVQGQRGEQVVLAEVVDTIPSQGADCTVVVAPPGSSPTTTTAVGGAAGVTTAPGGAAPTTASTAG